MPKKTELEGMRFGLLTVNTRKGISLSTKRVYWNCTCDCGNPVVKSTTSLYTIKTLHCGCQAITPEQISCNQLMLRYKHTAKTRNQIFLLSNDVFAKFLKGNCFYCGAVPHRLFQSAGTKRAKMLYNGIDRKNTETGYIESNCVSCCWTCNQAKRDMSFNGFKTWIKTVHDNVYKNEKDEK